MKRREFVTPHACEQWLAYLRGIGYNMRHMGKPTNEGDMVISSEGGKFSVIWIPLPGMSFDENNTTKYLSRSESHGTY